MKHYLFILFYVFCNAIVYLFQGSWLVYLVLFLGFFFVVVWGAFDIQLNYFVNSICRKRTKKREIALTFDDGPTEYTPLFLDLLKENDIQATFFCIGKQIEKYPEIFRRIREEGHSIGNHTYSHSHSTGFLSARKMEEEIRNCDAVMWQHGQVQTDFYRPPFGVTNPHIAQAIRKIGKKSIGWNVRSLDTIIEDKNKIYKRIVKKIRPGSIVLMHDTSEKTYAVLVELLLFLKHENYRSVSIDRFLNEK